MLTHHDGKVALGGGLWGNALALTYLLGDAWRELALTPDGDGFRAADEIVEAHVAFSGPADALAYELSYRATRPTRLRLMLNVPDAAAPFHIIPANIFGDNNLAKAEPGHYPNLTAAHTGNVSCATTWELRADRASHPVSLLCFDGGIAGISIDPYSACWISKTTSREGFIRNGLVAQLATSAQPNACGVSLGYGNVPVSFINKDTWGVPTQHLATEATASGRIFLAKAASRMDVHALIREVYEQYRETPECPINGRDAVLALTDAFLTVNWNEDKQNFTNMQCSDPEKKALRAWRTLPEVGWTGGGVIGYPLLAAGHVLGDPFAGERARYMLDWVARAHNPASGLLWDVCGKQEGKRVNWWWSGYIVKDCHCAYTNGSGLYYLLKSYAFCRQRGEDRPEWLATALKALDTIVQLQQPGGNFGYTYSTERPVILDADGFAGVWFVPALACAWEFTKDQRYLDAAERGIRFYHAFVRNLNCYGTPMDTWKSVDQEGNLGFVRGAQRLHALTGRDEYLEMLADGAHYEYLWRYGFRARPEYAPLKGSHWNSCGGSVTSVSNPHIHPMGIFISSELKYLADQTGDAYHLARFEDGINWAINAVSLYPEVAGYGKRGVLTERFCPSDGLTIEKFPDGSPSSLWFSYNGWGAAAVLEGIVEQMAE